ncbi:metal-dependent transcriptional regulator [Candidatus Woesearchaeota archaeon]|nr:metal-dependent transcriptional regulator [Candidatus Woesearchaeota archaeon]
MNISEEDYLRTIYKLYEDLEDKSLGMKAVDIARGLKITKPSVSGMVRKLTNLGLLKTLPYSRIHFTKKGMAKAKRIMHNHRVIEVFLKDVLKYKKKDVHDEAHILEHAFSEESIRRLDSFLNNPKKSPLGKVIPHEFAGVKE